MTSDHKDGFKTSLACPSPKTPYPVINPATSAMIDNTTTSIIRFILVPKYLITRTVFTSQY